MNENIILYKFSSNAVIGVTACNRIMISLVSDRNNRQYELLYKSIDILDDGITFRISLGVT